MLKISFYALRVELDRLHILPDCPDSRLSEQPMVRPIVTVTDHLLKCLVYRGGGKEGQFIKVNYHIQSRHGIMIIGPW